MLPSTSIPLSLTLDDTATSTIEVSRDMGTATGTTDGGAPLAALSNEFGNTTIATNTTSKSGRKRIIKMQPESGNIIVCAYACHSGGHAIEGRFYGRFTEKLVQHIHMREDIELMLGRVKKDLEACEQPPCIEVEPSMFGPRAQRTERFCLVRYFSISAASCSSWLSSQIPSCNCFGT